MDNFDDATAFSSAMPRGAPLAAAFLARMAAY
jgi:hypothetical protein